MEFLLNLMGTLMMSDDAILKKDLSSYKVVY